jgi:hypothetical protein
MSIPYAAGSLYSTVEDLYMWDQALYGEKILSAKSKELMFKPNLNSYGYGLVIRKATLGPNKFEVPVIQHGGGINGFNTTIVRMVNEKRLVVLLDNAEDGPYLDRMAGTIMSVLYDQPYDLPKQSIATVLGKTVQTNGVAAAVKQYRALKAGANAAEFDFAEGELNQLGYRLLQAKGLADAIDIFKLNVEMYPQSANVYDSLGEAYMTNGDKDLAIANYKKSLELNPGNTNATVKLGELTGEKKEVKVDPKIYDSYAGEYQVTPTFTIIITSENGKLMAQATGQQKFEHPRPGNRLYLGLFRSGQLVKDTEEGNLTLTQNGQNSKENKVNQNVVGVRPVL